MTVEKITFAAFLLSVTLSLPFARAQIRGLNYATPAYIDFELHEVTVDEDQVVVVLNVYRTGDFRQITRVDFVTEEDTATEGEDYRGTGGTIVFQPGEGFKRVEIGLISDDRAEGDEAFRLVIKDPGPNTVLMRDSATIRILEPAKPFSGPRLQIASVGDGKVVLSWEGEPNYTLERTVESVSRWEPVTGSPTVTGRRCEVIAETSEIIQLYRLRL